MKSIKSLKAYQSRGSQFHSVSHILQDSEKSWAARRTVDEGVDDISHCKAIEGLVGALILAIALMLE